MSLCLFAKAYAQAKNRQKQNLQKVGKTDPPTAYE